MKEAEQARSKHLSHAVIADALLDLEPNDLFERENLQLKSPEGCWTSNQCKRLVLQLKVGRS